MTRLPWYHTAFLGDYIDRYAHRNDDEARLAVRNLVLPLGLEPGSLVLDLACGAGRHSVELAREGFRVVGGDLSMALLLNARGQFSPQQTRFSPVRLDMRQLPFSPAVFDTVTNFFTAFGYFDQDAENFRVFGEVARVLRPGGTFVFDFLNAAHVREDLERHAGKPLWQHRAGIRWKVTKSLSDDGRRALKHQVSDAGQEIRESVRLFHPAELLAAMRATCLEPVRTLGSYEGEQFDPDTSPRFIVLATKTT